MGYYVEVRFLFKTFLLLLFYSSVICQTETGTIAGTITEMKSGEYAISVSVYLVDTDTTSGKKVISGTYTNKFGFYSISDVEPGEYIISVNALGYKTYFSKVNLKSGEEITKNIQLIVADITTDEVMVEADRDANPTSRIGTVNIKPTFLENMPFLFESDVFRALQLLPGIQQGNELSSGLYIRGGSPDQNLILLDDVIVYNPSHLGGFLSTFNSDALRDIKVIKGAFPAEYGGRLSAVVDMTMKEGTKEKISGEGAVSIVSSKLTVEGPITEDATFMISGRRMYLDLLTEAAFSADDEVPIYYFYDLNAKLNYKISENDRVFLSGFFGRDVLGSNSDDNADFEIFWGNKTGNLRWMHIVSPKLFTNFSLIYTDYNFTTQIIDNDYNQDLEILSGINDVTLKANAEYFPVKEHTIKTGIEATWHGFKSGVDMNIRRLDDEFPEEKIQTFDAAYFVQDEWNITPLLSSNIGARLYYFENGNYLNLEPRLSLSYQLTDKLSVNSSFAVANQYLHLIVRNDITLPTDLWFPSTENIKPSCSMQGSLGLEAELFDGEYIFTTEFYYKDLQNIYEFKEDADFGFGIPLEEQFTSGRGEAYGMELFLNKRIGKLTGWIGYTLSWTKRYFDEINNGNWYYPRYDRRHDISIVLNYKASESWEISASWIYGTGQAYTMPTGLYYLPDPDFWGHTNEKYQYTDRNGYRLPPYHRFDVNFIHHYEWFGLPWKFYLSIYNAYSRRNPFAWYITYDYDEHNASGDYKKVVKQITLFPIIPNIGLSFSF